MKKTLFTILVIAVFSAGFFGGYKVALRQSPNVNDFNIAGGFKSVLNEELKSLNEVHRKTYGYRYGIETSFFSGPVIVIFISGQKNVIPIRDIAKRVLIFRDDSFVIEKDWGRIRPMATSMARKIIGL